MANNTMKAVVVKREGATFSIVVEEVPRPVPEAGQLLIKIFASSIQPSDILNSKGSFGHTTFPRTTGRDFAGVVVEGSQDWVNKKVYGTSGHDFSFTTNGAHAEYAVVSEKAVATLPRNLSYKQASSLGTPWSTAHLTLDRSRPQPGETIMVLGGTGSVGSAVVSIARLKGFNVIAVGRHGTDVSSVSDPALATAKVLTGGRGPDVVVDTVGDLTLMQASLDVMANFGRLVNISAPRQGDTHLPVDVFKLYRKQLSIIDCNSVETPLEQLTASLQDIVPGFESGALKAPDDHAWTTIGIDQAPDAFAGKIKKAVIVFDE